MQKQKFKVLGIDRDHTQCECCGRSNLKLTVIVARLDADGQPLDVVRFGRDCAARATRLRRTGAAMETLGLEAQRAAEARKAKTEIVLSRSGDPWTVYVVYQVGQNGGSLRRLVGLIGLRTEVDRYVASTYQNVQVHVERRVSVPHFADSAAWERYLAARESN